MQSLRKLSQVLALSGLLVLPALCGAGPARAEGGGGGDATDSRAGVVAAVACGVTAGWAARTGLAPLLTLSIVFCGYMLIDAFITPD